MKSKVLLIGAGPAGLAAASCLKDEGVAFHWVDKNGQSGGAYRRMYPKLVLSSPGRYNSLPSIPFESKGEYHSAADYAAYLARYARELGLSPEKAEVERLDRWGEGFQASFAGGRRESYDLVVAATGMFDHPCRPDIPGLKGSGLDVLHAREWPGPERFQGRRLLIVGGGMTGIELAEESAEAGLKVALSARRGRVRPIPQRILGLELHDFAWLIERLPAGLFPGYCGGRQRFPGTDLGFKEHVREGRITVHHEVERFEGRTAACADGTRLEVDAVVLATGYAHAIPFLPAEVTRTPGGHPASKEGESADWPGLFFMGTPCARGLASPFLRGMAEDAPPMARAVKERLN